jgi:phosphoribosylaminoimidazolecarboxamide formyltransferase/IMP cyclohydrolase
MRATCELDGDLSELATAYARARDCDPRSSYGDVVALSHPVDVATARMLARFVSDGVIAPEFEEGVVGVLARKKGGRFLVLRMDRDHAPLEREVRDVFGVRIVQDRDSTIIDRRVLGDVAHLPADLVEDAVLGLISARHAQSDAVVCVAGGRTLGIGTGQQSRVDCVRLAGQKADRWRLRRHPRLAAAELPGGLSIQDRGNRQMELVEGDALSADEKRAWLARERPCTLASDAYLPFRDNVDVAAEHGVRCLVEGGGSRRSDEVELACREHGITLLRTGLRLFSH